MAKGQTLPAPAPAPTKNKTLQNFAVGAPLFLILHLRFLSKYIPIYPTPSSPRQHGTRALGAGTDTGRVWEKGMTNDGAK